MENLSSLKEIATEFSLKDKCLRLYGIEPNEFNQYSETAFTPNPKDYPTMPVLVAANGEKSHYEDRENQIINHGSELPFEVLGTSDTILESEIVVPNILSGIDPVILSSVACLDESHNGEDTFSTFANTTQIFSDNNQILAFSSSSISSQNPPSEPFFFLDDDPKI
ncbi:uncharacterized protein RJT20DRAFT_59971 [Scheffersomyces xylosifermentans]|uniref:uncharacterized protein n=1 Tax=Scheffersomyces xylosifermentans TaxID=1304137 RepID=UPI00315CA3A7